MPDGKNIIRQLPDNWEEKILEFYSEGMSDYEVMTELKLHYSTFTRLMSDPTFAEVVQFGRQASRAWWERAGRINLSNKDFNAMLWKTNVQNRLGWSDKTTSHESDSGFEKALSGDELDQEIERRLRSVRSVRKEEVKGG